MIKISNVKVFCYGQTFLSNILKNPVLVTKKFGVSKDGKDLLKNSYRKETTKVYTKDIFKSSIYFTPALPRLQKRCQYLLPIFYRRSNVPVCVLKSIAFIFIAQYIIPSLNFTNLPSIRILMRICI